MLPGLVKILETFHLSKWCFWLTLWKLSYILLINLKIGSNRLNSKIGYFGGDLSGGGGGDGELEHEVGEIFLGGEWFFCHS